MKKVESYVKRWYDYLEDGKIMGVKCKHCGAYEFPPVPICNTCGAHDMEWVEMDGEGTLVAANDATMPMWGPEFGAVLSGIVELKEGPAFLSFITGVDDADRDSLFDKVPLKVHAEIQQRDGFKYPCFKYEKED